MSLKEQKESIKRIKQPENWKVNMKKNARLKGEEYIGVGGKWTETIKLRKFSSLFTQYKNLI
jgi:hypothetical protein